MDSGSMNHDNKWVAAIGAIDGIFTKMQTNADPGVGAGLIVYSDSQDPNLNVGGDYPTNIDVPIAFVDQPHRDKLVGRTAPPDAPQSNTPTGRALTGAYAELAGFQAPAPLLPNGKKVVVLLTDGIPTDRDCKTMSKDGSEDYPNNFCVKMAATQLATTGPMGPIETFVIGTGPVPGDFEMIRHLFSRAPRGRRRLRAARLRPQGQHRRRDELLLLPDRSHRCHGRQDPAGVHGRHRRHPRPGLVVHAGHQRNGRGHHRSGARQRDSERFDGSQGSRQRIGPTTTPEPEVGHTRPWHGVRQAQGRLAGGGLHRPRVSVGDSTIN